MATLNLSVAAGDAALDTIADLIDAGTGSGTIDIYDGTMPATPETAVTTQTLLATLTFATTAFQASSANSATANAITKEDAALATGTATWARIEDSNGVAIMDVDVGTSNATINLNTTDIVAGGEVVINSATLNFSV